MPITVTAPSGELTAIGEREILPRLTHALLEATGAVGNGFLTSIVGGTVHVLDADRIYAGGINRPVVMVELKLPSVALSSPDTRSSFIAAATEIVDALTVDGHDRRDTWVNILHAPDRGWGIGGRAYSDADLLAEDSAVLES
jgi:phenylpyruvate tautomerase PptA (4-oxalocrotonate tautomerase family)